MATINLELPDDLRDRFKAVCALRRSTMRAELIAFIRAEVEKLGTPKGGARK